MAPCRISIARVTDHAPISGAEQGGQSEGRPVSRDAQAASGALRDTVQDWIGPLSGMDAVRGLLVGVCITLAALVHQAGGQLPLLKVFSSALAIAVVLFRVAVCQNDFQDVPALTALNCSSVTDCT